MKLKLDGTGLEKQKLKILCCEKEDILVTCKVEDFVKWNLDFIFIDIWICASIGL